MANKLTPRFITDENQIEALPNESWVVIQSHPNYTLSNYGRVISYAKKHPILLSPQQDAVGYYHYRLFKKDESGKSICTLFKVHRLVAMYFLPKPINIDALEVNHMDGDKSNNAASNLEWCTRSYNQKHAYILGLKIKDRRFGKRIPIEVFDNKGRSLGQFNSMIDAAWVLGVTETNISRWLRGYESHKGYTVVPLDKNGQYQNPMSSLTKEQRQEKRRKKAEYIKSLNQNKQ